MRLSRSRLVVGLALAVAALLAFVASGVAYAQVTRAVTVDLLEWELRPNTLTFPAGTTITFTARNLQTARLPHAIQIRGPGLDRQTADLAPGSQATLTVTFTQPGRYEFFCPVGAGSHRQAGMDGSITITAAAAPAPAARPAPAPAALPQTGGGAAGLALAAFAALGGTLALGTGIALRHRRR